MTSHLTGQRFEVPVDLDKPRLLRIDFNALVRAEQVSGLSFLDWNAELTATRLKALTWAAIVYEPDETRLEYDEVGDILNAKCLEVVNAISEAWVDSMPEAKMVEAEEDPPKAATAPS